jgi:hypothetical protein
MKTFDIAKFQNPNSGCYPGYFWFINSEMTKEELIKQIHDRYDHGG